MIYVKFRISNIGDFLKYEKFRNWDHGINGLLGSRGLKTDCISQLSNGCLMAISI